MKYRAEIDGLRAVAVVPVILFHAGYEMFSGGFVGVDVFFVISGYLITSILIAELDNGKFSLIDFYERRSRRILPALFLIMAISTVFAWLWFLQEDYIRFSQSLVAVSVFSSNVLFWLTSNYFDTSAELKPLLHTWSLGVEEQFYVFFPLLLLFAWKLKRTYLMALLGVAAAVSLILSQLAISISPAGAFYLLPTRGWELLVGAFVSFAEAGRGRVNTSAQVNQAGSLAGLALLLIAMFAYDKTTPFPGVAAILPVAGTALIILFARADNYVGKLLSFRWLVGIGLISYSAYLWHQPLFAFARYRTLDGTNEWLMGGLSVLSIGLAYISWRYVEAPFRDKRRVSKLQVFLFSIVGSVLFICIGLAGHVSKGFQQRLQFSSDLSEIDLPKKENGWCFYSNQSGRPGPGGTQCWLGDENGSQKALLIGDSFAGQYEPFWDEIGQKSRLRVNAVTASWCHPALDNSFPGPLLNPSYQQCLINRAYLREQISHYDIVILGGSWAELIDAELLDTAIEAIEFAAEKAPLVVVMPAPKQFDTHVMNDFKKANLYDMDLDISEISTEADLAALEAHARIREVTGTLENVIFLERGDLFQWEEGPEDISDEGVPFSLDGRHISIFGSRKAAEIFLRSPSYAELIKRLEDGD